MLRRAEYFRGRANFRNLAGIENQNPVGKPGQNCRIVRDENHRAMQLIAQRSKKLKNILLGGRIEGSGWLVGNNERRATRNCLRQQDALPLASAQLMRIRLSDSIRVR